MKPLTYSLLSIGLAQALLTPTVHASADIERYAGSDFAYCDAVILGSFWRTSVADAKATIGRRIDTSAEASIDTDLKDARSAGMQCEFSDTGLSFEDAEAVARLWQTDIAEAKAELTAKVSTGLRWLANEVLAEARAADRSAAATMPLPRDDRQADLQRFGVSAYEYCDAVLLGDIWGDSIDEAKIRIGLKLRLNNEAALIGDLDTARRRGSRCTFEESGFDYADADALARLWGTSVAEAKSLLAEKVSLGNRELANQAVREARNPRSIR